MKKTVFLILLILPWVGRTQVMLSLKSAIDTTLRHNFDILIAGNYASIGKINNTYGMAGGLPTVGLSVSDNQAVTDSRQKSASGEETNYYGVSGNSLTSGITAGMVLFNGFKVVATKERLNLLQQQSEIEFNIQVQNTIAAVMQTYYDIIRQQEYLKIMNASLDVSKKKLEIITARRSVGMANDADLFQAQIDVNTAQQAVNNQQLVVEQSKTDLLELMSQNKFYPFGINDSIMPDASLQQDKIIGYLKNNPQYLSAEQQIRINEQLVKETSALRYPSLKLNTGLNLNQANYNGGPTKQSQNFGPYAGLSLQVPIYNGNTYKIQKETAVYNLQNAKLQKENLLNMLSSDAVRTFQSYDNALKQLQSQESSLELSGRLINVVMERFKLNQATILEVKAAQASYESTGYLLINLKYAAKVAEIELKRLTYQLGN